MKTKKPQTKKYLVENSFGWIKLLINHVTSSSIKSKTLEKAVF